MEPDFREIVGQMAEKLADWLGSNPRLPEELDRISHRKFIQTAFKEGKIIYESR